MKKLFMLSFVILFAAACGKDSSTSNGSTSSNGLNWTTGGTTSGTQFQTFDQLKSAFNSKSTTAGLAANNTIVHVTKHFQASEINNNFLNNVLSFLNTQVGTVTYSYDVIKVISVSSGLSISTCSASYVCNPFNPAFTYTKSGDAQLNKILSLHNGAAQITNMRPATISVSGMQASGVQIDMSEGGVSYRYILSTDLPIIANPVVSVDGSTGEMSFLQGASVQVQN
jgi:hypothetical protein